MQNNMKMEQLEFFGIPSYLVSIWKEHYSPFLLPIQEKAVRQFHLLQSANTCIFSSEYQATNRNLLVISPSSSGKTLVGEIAAMQEICLQKKVVFLVPLRVLAEEKYQHFLRLYRSIGLKIKISSRDHRQDDHDIIYGHFHIAVIVYEKFYYLLLQHPQFLKNISLLIADEIQIMNDPERGPRLENIFTYLANHHPRICIIALCAFTENAFWLGKWLNASVLFSAYRPVELRKGIVRNGIYQYIEHNTKTIGKEVFFPKDEAWECNLASYLRATLDYLVNRNESSLVFFPTRKEVRLWSRWLAGQFCLPAADKAIDELHAMEDCTSQEELISLLQKGITYHCADLSWQERHLIEESVQAGDIKIICSTDTLSMGINLPVNNVILTGQKTFSEKKSEKSLTAYYKRALTISEVENMGGRAGRFNQYKDFGRIIFLAPSLIELTTYQKLYFNHFKQRAARLPQSFYPAFQESPSHLREGSPIEEGSTQTNLAITTPAIPLDHIYLRERPLSIEQDLFLFLLEKIALTCQSIEHIYAIFQFEKEKDDKYFWRHQISQEFSKKELLSFLHHLENEQLIRIENEDSCQITKMGSLIVSKGISYPSYIHFRKWLNQCQQDPISELEILFLIANSSDGEDFFIPYPRNGKKIRKKSSENRWEHYLLMRILQLIFEQGEEDKPIFCHHLMPHRSQETTTNQKSELTKYLAIKKTLLMVDWISGRELKEIEEEYGMLSGSIQKMGEGFSWLADTLAAIAGKMGWKERRRADFEKIQQLSARLITGVEPEGLALAQLQIPGLSRGYIQRLVQEGYDNEQCLQELDENQLGPLLPKLLIQRIKKHLALNQNSNLPYMTDKKPEMKKHDTTLLENKIKPVLRIDSDRPDQISLNQGIISVNKITFQLISLLAKKQGKILSYEKIIDTLWPEDDDATYHRLWYHLGKLRNSMQEILSNQHLSGVSTNDIKERVLKVFPGRGLMLDTGILVQIKE